MKKLALLAFLVLLGGMAQAEQVQLQLNRNDPADNRVGVLTFLGAVVLPEGVGKIGGLSSLYVGPRDSDWLALSDTDRLFKGHLVWKDDRLVGATLDAGTKLLDDDGSTPSRRARFDSESMVRQADGSWLVGYERDHRIERFVADNAGPSGKPVPLPTPPGLLSLPRNEGLEALAALKDGRVLALAEHGEAGVHQAWLWQEGHWLKLSYHTTDGFDPSDATVLPSGDVLVLERSLNFFYGFRSRIILLRRVDIKGDAVLTGKELALLESPRLAENFEGIHAIPGPDGKVRVFIVSDNNFTTLQQTILAAFELTSP